MAIILKSNPWIAARIVKKTTADGVIALAYARNIDFESTVDRHFTIYKPGQIGLSLDLAYNGLGDCLLPV